MKLINKTRNNVITENLLVADTYYKRLKGLMFTKELPINNALHITPCNEIHTFFMNYSIDVLYLDINNNILSIDEELKPGKIGRYVKGAVCVIELPSGRIKSQGILIGQTVEFTKD